MSEKTDYDIALSFAGEDRDYVDRVAAQLRDCGVRVFYDLFEEADLWGKDLYVHLSDIYRQRARFTVMFISEAYARKLWTNHERQAAQARAFQDAQEYILPARFDDTPIPGVLPTVGYVSLKERSPEDFASLVLRKLVSAGGSVPTELVRNDFGTMSQTELPPGSSLSVTIKDDEGNPVSAAGVYLQAANGTFNTQSTDADGTAVFDLKVRRTVTLLVAHPDFPAMVVEMIDPDGAIEIGLTKTNNVGSVLMRGTGYIPQFKGRLSPILDSSRRTYLYATNIAINDGKGQPVAFRVNEPIKLEDADGTVVYVTVKHIAGDIALLQYTTR